MALRTTGGVLLIVGLFLTLMFGIIAINDQISSATIDPAYNERVGTAQEIATTTITVLGWSAFIVAALIVINSFRAI